MAKELRFDGPFILVILFSVMPHRGPETVFRGLWAFLRLESRGITPASFGVQTRTSIGGAGMGWIILSRLADDDFA